jgi:hypothetical protein
VRANLSSPFDEADRSRRGGSRERATAMEEAMESLPEPGEGRVKYLVDTFERLLLLAGGGPEARRGGGSRRRVSEATPTTASASTRTPPPEAEEIDVVSYPSSEVSFPAIAGVACILDASDRTRCVPPPPRFVVPNRPPFLTPDPPAGFFLGEFSMIRAARERRRRRQRRCNVSTPS